MLKLIHAPAESRCPETRQGHAVTDCCMQQSWRFQPRLPPGDGHAAVGLPEAGGRLTVYVKCSFCTMAAKAAFPVKVPEARLLRMKLPPAEIYAKIRCKINCLTSSLLRKATVCVSVG